jgi:hypothetical protein
MASRAKAMGSNDVNPREGITTDIQKDPKVAGEAVVVQTT